MTPAPRVAVIVAAGGSGERLGAGVPKALVPLGGVPLVLHAVEAMAAADGVGTVVVSVPAGEIAAVVELCRALQLSLTARGVSLTVVAGGETRQSSVRRALDACGDPADVVLVHDAARPLAPTALADAVIAAVRAGADAVVPGLPVADTVKVVDATDLVTGTPDRATLRAVQTPQGFRRAVLEQAHAAAPAVATEGDLASATDDAGLVERLGLDVRVVPGHEDAFKVTRPLDLVLAEAVLARRGQAPA